jgi:hypothetical protein
LTTLLDYTFTLPLPSCGVCAVSGPALPRSASPKIRQSLYSFPFKVGQRPIKKSNGTPQTVDRSPSKSHHRPSIIIRFTLNSFPLLSNVKYPPPRVQGELANHHKPYKSLNKHFNYQACQNRDLVYFISQDCPNRFRCNFQWSSSAIMNLSNGSISKSFYRDEVEKNRESRKKRSDGRNCRNTGDIQGPLNKLKCHFFAQKTNRFPLKTRSASYQKIHRYPSKSHPRPSIIMPFTLYSCSLPSNVENAFHRESNVNWPIVIPLSQIFLSHLNRRYSRMEESLTRKDWLFTCTTSRYIRARQVKFSWLNIIWQYDMVQTPSLLTRPRA